jgi:hypothetical protein
MSTGKRPGLVLRDASLRDAAQHEGFGKCAWPRHDDALRSLSCLLFNCQTARRLSADVRHRPCSHLGAGLAVLVLFLLPIGACGTSGRKAAPAAPACFACRHPVCRHLGNVIRGTRAPFGHTGEVQLNVEKPLSRTGLGSRSSPAFRTRMDLSACWMSQGWLLTPASPRSFELSPGHTLEPSAPLAVVCPVHPLGQPVLEDMGARQALRTSASRSTRETIAHAPYRYGTAK